MIQKQKVSRSQGNEKQWYVFGILVWVELKVCIRVLKDVAGWGWTKEAFVSL